MKLFSKFMLASLAVSFATLAPHAFASDPISTQPLVDWSKKILSDVKAPTWTDAACVSYLSALEDKIDQVGVSTPTLNLSDLKPQADAITANLWLSRLALHDHLAGASDACAVEIRNTFRKFRFVEDFLSEISRNVTAIVPENMDFQTQKVPTIENPDYYLTQSADGGPIKLQEGDLIIARGFTPLSAMIARLGDVDSQFSHVILVAKNPITGILQTIESYVGTGVDFHEMNWALKNENVRLLVLRGKDQVLAKKAASMMWANVNNRTAAEHIPYDYSLNFNDPSAMSCAEVAKVAWWNASGGTFNLPERPSTLSRGKDLLKRLGIVSGPTFTPGDLEDDSRFDIVGEYRDLRLTRDSRLKDAILTKMLEWMDKENYTLHPDFTAKMARGPIWSLRHTFVWPLVHKIIGGDDFSAEVPRAMVGTVQLIKEFTVGILKELQEADESQFQGTGLRMSYLDLYQTLENIKVADEQIYANPHTRKKSILIKYLRSDE
jgi:hypothetical protein